MMHFELMIEFSVYAKSYNSYGGHSSLSMIGSFLLMEAPEFGDAVKEITVTHHFAHSGLAKKSLEKLLEMHNSHRATLPKITFRRAKGQIDIHIASEVMDGRDWKPSLPLSLPLFVKGVDEVIKAMSLISCG